jgi:hypothetical protein
MAPHRGLEPRSSVLETDTSPLNACGILAERIGIEPIEPCGSTV